MFAVIMAMTIASGFDLQAAIDQARPGDTVRVPAGVYVGPFTSNVSGTADQPIQFVAEPVVVLDAPLGSGSVLTIRGAHTHWVGFEVLCSDPKRVWDEPGYPADGRPTGLHVTGPATRIINCTIRDCGTGVGLWKAAHDSELYGCLIYNNGWVGSDRRHGVGLYTQNEIGVKTIEENVFFGNYSNEVQAYGSSSAPVIGYRFLGNVILGESLIGGRGETREVAATDNHFVGHTRFGYTFPSNQNGRFSWNVLFGSIEFNRWRSLVVAANVLDGSVRYERPTGEYQWTIEGNTGQPIGTRISFRVNRYDPNRALLVVWNWSGEQAVTVDTTGFLAAGDRYVIREARRLGEHYQCGIAIGGSIVVPILRKLNVFLLERE